MFYHKNENVFKQTPIDPTLTKYGIRFYANHKVLKDICFDLARCLDTRPPDLKLDIFVGAHDQTILKDTRLTLAIQTECFNTSCGKESWLELPRAKVVESVMLADFVLDFNPYNLAFYRDIPNFDFNKLILGPYAFPKFRPNNCIPSSPDLVFFGHTKNRRHRINKLKQFENKFGSIRIFKDSFGMQMANEISSNSGVLNLHSAAVVVTELPRILKAYLNGNIVVSEPLDMPFISGRHYIEICDFNDNGIDHDLRNRIIDNIHKDFSIYQFNKLLTHIHKLSTRYKN